MSEPQGIEQEQETCIVCHATQDMAAQWDGTCIDAFGCTARYVGIQQRVALIRNGGISGGDLERRILQNHENNDHH